MLTPVVLNDVFLPYFTAFEADTLVVEYFDREVDHASEVGFCTVVALHKGQLVMREERHFIDHEDGSQVAIPDEDDVLWDGRLNTATDEEYLFACAFIMEQVFAE